MKIGIVGDLHIAPCPEKRIDDYFQTGLNKIEEISKECDKVIFLGDIFTRSRVDEPVVIKLINSLFYNKITYGVEYYTIIGNHDVDHEDESNIVNSSLGVLAASGAIKLITIDNPLILQDGNVIYNFVTIPVKYSNAIQYNVPKPLDNYENILLIHHEYETGTNCFTYNDLKDKGYKSVFFGHDHKPMDGGRIIYPEFTAYRSGSIMRNRADEYNFTRTLYYYILEQGNVSCRAVTTIPFDKVFKIEAINKIEYQEKQYTEALDKLIDKYENNTSVQDKFSIRKILEETLKAKPEIINYIDKQYKKLNEILV